MPFRIGTRLARVSSDLAVEPRVVRGFESDDPPTP
jgi:hypothetical protein